MRHGHRHHQHRDGHCDGGSPGEAHHPLDRLGTGFEYDARGDLTAITDPVQNPEPPGQRLKTQFTHNAAGQPLTVTDPLGHPTTFTYDGAGNPATVTDPLGNTSQRTYDPVSRLLTQTNPPLAGRLSSAMIH